MVNIDTYINKPSETIKIIKANIDTDQLALKEFLWILLLSPSNRILGMSHISTGGVNSVSLNIREITQLALLTNARKVIVAHNHPSEIVHPSERDISSTKDLIEALSLFEISLMDHLIITDTDFYSFHGDGKIK